MQRLAIALGTVLVLCASIFVQAKPAAAYVQSGVASYYCCQFAGRLTANGERFNPGAMTAAHRYLRFGTYVRVTALRTGKSVVVRINDRGPFVGSRIIDLSAGAAAVIGIKGSGIGQVRLEVIGGGGQPTLIARKGNRAKSGVAIASARSKLRHTLIARANARHHAKATLVARAHHKAKARVLLASARHKKSVVVAASARAKKSTALLAVYKKPLPASTSAALKKKKKPVLLEQVPAAE